MTGRAPRAPIDAVLPLGASMSTAPPPALIEALIQAPAPDGGYRLPAAWLASSTARSFS